MSHKCEHGKDSDICARCHEDLHVPLETGRHLGKSVGRPPREGEVATGQIQLRVTMARKNAYVQAAKPKSLAAWMFEILDKAANYKP